MKTKVRPFNPIYTFSASGVLSTVKVLTSLVENKANDGRGLASKKIRNSIISCQTITVTVKSKNHCTNVSTFLIAAYGNPMWTCQIPNIL